MQPGDFLCELDRIAMAPAGPEAALSAVIAVVRASARELHDDGAHSAVVAIIGVVDQFPPNAIGVEIFDHRGGARFDDASPLAEGDAIDRAEMVALFDRAHEPR